MEELNQSEYFDDGFINNIISRHMICKHDLSHMWIIIIDGKIVSDGTGKCLYYSKDQATKAFYNMFRWQVRSRLWRTIHNEFPNIFSSPQLPASAQNALNNSWKKFKKTIIDKHNFQIIQLNGES